MRRSGEQQVAPGSETLCALFGDAPASTCSTSCRSICRNLDLVEHSVMRRLARAGVRPRPSAHGARRRLVLREDTALALGLPFRAPPPCAAATTSARSRPASRPWNPRKPPIGWGWPCTVDDRAAFRLLHHGGERLLVAFRRQGNPDGLGGEPRLHLPPCGGHRGGARKDARVAGDPREREQAGPRQAYRRGGVDPFVEPLVRPRVLRERGHVRVDQQIGVDEDHRNSSPSATASTSATSSRLPARHEPRSTVGVR